jgi:hypothetical protein
LSFHAAKLFTFSFVDVFYVSGGSQTDSEVLLRFSNVSNEIVKFYPKIVGNLNDSQSFGRLEESTVSSRASQTVRRLEEATKASQTWNPPYNFPPNSLRTSPRLSSSTIIFLCFSISISFVLRFFSSFFAQIEQAKRICAHFYVNENVKSNLLEEKRKFREIIYS